MGRWSLSQRHAPPPPPPGQKAEPPLPPLGRRRHTPGQRDAGRLLPCALPRESVSGNFSRRHVLGATTTTTTTTYTIPYHTIPYHTIPYHTIPYHTIPYHTIPYHTIPYHTIPYHTPLRVRPRSLAFTERSPPARPPTPHCGALGASADRRLGRPRLPATATGPAPAPAPPPPRPPAATHAPGPGLSPQATQPAHRRSLGPQRGPHRARRRPCARAPRSLACRTRPPPARPPTPLCGALRATADRRLDRPHPPAAATGPAPAWRRVRLGRPPLPMRPARASTPRRLCRAASRKQDTGTGTRGQHLNRTRHASNCIPMIVLLCSRPCALPPP